MAKPRFPRLEITVSDGEAIFTTVTLDGARLPVTRVSFDSGDKIDGLVKVRLELYADLSLNATGQKLVLVSPDE